MGIGRRRGLESERAVTATDVHRRPGPNRSRDTPGVDAGVPDQPPSMGRVEEVLRILPSHGWTAGWVGRCDRAMLVLSQLAGLSYKKVAALTAGDLTVADGVATIRTPGGKTTLRDVADDLLCGPCALARWVHALDLMVVYPDTRVLAAVIARAVPLAPDSPHLCHSGNAVTQITRQVPLLPAIDRWGHPDRTTLMPPLPLMRAVGTTRRHFVPIQHTPPRPLAPCVVTHRAQALQVRVEQLLDSSTR